jgi:hypothetical protein
MDPVNREIDQKANMPATAAVQNKLREARYFYGRLVESHRRLGMGEDPEVFGYLLSAFLTAGRSVLAIHAFLDGRWDNSGPKPRFRDNWGYYDKWMNTLREDQRTGDVSVLSVMRDERDQSVHKQGFTLDHSTEFVPLTSIVSTNRSHPAYGLQWFGPPGIDPPRIGRPVYAFQGTGDEVLTAAHRYLELLEEFAAAYEADHLGTDSNV